MFQVWIIIIDLKTDSRKVSIKVFQCFSLNYLTYLPPQLIYARPEQQSI